jgi:Circadian oscillating protein COP23
MKNYLSSVCTAILLMAAIGNNHPASAVSSQPAQSQITPNSQLVSQNETAEEAKMKFTCGTSHNPRLNKRVPTTLSWSPDGNKRALIQWVKQMDSNWTPEKRCQEVSKRMQEATNAGTMQYITNGKMNGQRVICSATEVNGDCKNLLMTLRSGDKASQFMSEFQDVFNGRSEGPIPHSSGEPQIYLRIDLNQLWRNAAKAN